MTEIDRAQVWRFSDQQDVARIPHEESVKALAFSPDGSYIVTGAMTNAYCFPR